MSFEWVVPPSKLATAIGEWEKRCRVALFAVANAWGQKIQDEARGSAPWEDRTGNARGGLFFAVDGFGMGTVTGDKSGWRGAKIEQMEATVSIQGDEDTLIVVLGHTMWYGKFLELSNGGRNAVILSTIERNLPGLEQLIRQAYGH